MFREFFPVPRACLKIIHALERVSKMLYVNRASQFVGNFSQMREAQRAALTECGANSPQALALIKKILRGAYRCNNGEEQIVLEDGKYVKINYSSSGQQESVWIGKFI